MSTLGKQQPWSDFLNRNKDKIAASFRKHFFQVLPQCNLDRRYTELVMETGDFLFQLYLTGLPSGDSGRGLDVGIRAAGY